MSYRILQDTKTGRAKRSVDVELSRRLSENELREFALAAFGSELDQYERTFIAYYLRGMTSGSGGWATTHANPNLTARILGLTSTQADTLSSLQFPTNWHITGKWLIDQGFLPSLVVIHRTNGRYRIAQYFADGSSVIEPLKRIRLGDSENNSMRFDYTPPDPDGVHFIITNTGSLEIWGDHTRLGSAPPVGH